jgi:hypothetical protein
MNGKIKQPRPILVTNTRRRRVRHEVLRLKQRTSLNNRDLLKLRRRLRRNTIPMGVNHVKMRDGSFAVVSTKNGKPLVMSFLTSSMHPPGTDVTPHLYKKKGPTTP